MVNKVKACILISGTGSNLESIIKSSRNYNFPIKIELIISNSLNAKGLKLAKKHPCRFLVYGPPQGYGEKSCPPLAAYSHSDSVGSLNSGKVGSPIFFK